MSKKPTKPEKKSRKEDVTTEQLLTLAAKLHELADNVRTSVDEMGTNKAESLFIDGLKTANIHAEAIEKFCKKLHGEAAFAKPKQTAKSAAIDLVKKRQQVRQAASTDKNAGGTK